MKKAFEIFPKALDIVIRRIKPGIVVIDAQACHLALAGEQPVGEDAAARPAGFAKGVIALLPHAVSVRICYHAGRAQMVFQDIVEGTLDPHSTCRGIVRDRSSDDTSRVLIHFIHTPDIQRPAGSS